MSKIVKALKGLEYRVITSRLTDEENMTWGNMIASAVSEQQAENLLPEETAWWNKSVKAESCLHCMYWGESDECSKH